MASDLSTDAWRRALTGDRDAFNEAVGPFNDDLLGAAERLLHIERGSGELGETDLTPEELVGETLLRAYDHRQRFDGDQMSFRAWLLGLQTRALSRFSAQEDNYAARKAISLDDEVPSGEDQDAVGEQFYEFRQPFDVDTYEELIAGSSTGDIVIDGLSDAPLSDDERAKLADVQLDVQGRQAVLLHDEFELSLPEVAQILDASLKDTAEHLNLARAGLRAHIGSVSIAPDDDDAIDSYTGDPVPEC